MLTEKNLSETQKNVLTCTITCRTLTGVDQTTQRILDKYADLQRQIGRLHKQAEALRITLEMVGIKPEEDALDTSWEATYAGQQPFINSSLVKTCKKILKDGGGQSYTTNEVEYLAAIGGHKFSTKDSRNSVDVTLRRLTEKGFCQVRRDEHRQINVYSWIESEDEKQE